MQWRLMTEADLAGVVGLSAAVHPGYPESPSVFAACLRLHPTGCHVLDMGERRIGGYLLSHPGRLDAPPALDAPLAALPAPCDCYYLHDLALGQAARGHGKAGAAVEIAIAEARRGGFDTLALIAVGEAHGFWRRQGFALLGDGRVDRAKGYGTEARALVRKI